MAEVLQAAVRQIRRLAELPGLENRSDRQLLELFARTREEAAFAALVRRHGPLVLGVCRRVLGHLQDAEDAFQATFLVLARKAAQVGWQDSVGNWLHGVAYRVALKARTASSRRRQREKEAAETAASSPSEDPWPDLRLILDEELQRLPGRYRAPLILCYFQGKTRDQAARELGWTAGSVKGRLERGREVLRHRLQRRGLALSLGLGAGVFSLDQVTAAVPVALSQAAIHGSLQFLSGLTAPISTTVLQLAQGVLQAMFLAKLKTIALVLLCAGIFSWIGGTFVHQALAQKTGTPSQLAFAQGEREKAEGERKPEKETPVLRGVLSSLDLAKNTITLKAGEKGQDNILPLAANARLTQNGRPAKLADFTPGQKVLATLSADRNSVVALQFFRGDGEVPREGPRDGDRPALTGVLLSIDAAKNTVDFLIGTEADLKRQTFSLDKDVKAGMRIGRNFQEMKLADLSAPIRASLQLSDQKTVLRIEVQAPTFRGTVRSLDADKRTITFAAGEREGQSQTFNVAADAKIYLKEQEVNLNQLAPGAPVMVTLSADRSRILVIQVFQREREGR